MSAERTVAKNTAWLVLQPLLMNVLSLAAIAYITRGLGATEFGRFNLGLGFVAMFAPLTNMGVRTLAIRHVAQHRDTAGNYLGRVMMLRMVLSFFCIAAIVAALPLSGASAAGTRSVILISAVGLLFTTGVQVLTDGFQSFEIVRPVTWAQMMGGLILTLASVVAIKLGAGIRGLALAYALGPFFTFLLLWHRSRGTDIYPRLAWDMTEFRQILRLAMPFCLLIVLDAVSARVDIVVVDRLLGDTRLGFYTAAMMLVDRATVLIDGAATALLPAIAHLSIHARGEALRLLRKATLWLLLISIPLAIMTTVFAPLIVRVIFGHKFAAGAVILAAGIWRLPAMCLAVITANALFAVRRQDIELRTQGIAMAFSIALVYPMVYLWGPIGGAWAMTSRHLIAFLIRLPAMQRFLPGFWPWQGLVRVAAALALMVAPLALVPSFRGSFLALGLAPISTLLYCIALVKLRIIPIEPLSNRIPGLRLWFPKKSERGTEPDFYSVNAPEPKAIDQDGRPIMPLTIVHTVSTLQVGGMERFVLQIACMQNQQGHSVTIIAMKDGPLAAEAWRMGLPVRVMSGPHKTVRMLRALWTMIRIRPDIVHAHNPTSLHFATLGKIACGAKVVMTDHGQGLGSLRVPSDREWGRTDAVVAVSNAVARRRDTPAIHEKMTVILNGVEATLGSRGRKRVRAELNLNDDQFVAIIVARIDGNKGHDTLLGAVSRLRDSGDPLQRVTLLVAGDGEKRPEMETLARELGLGEEWVRFLGFRSDAPDLLGAADLFVLPSLTEGLPLSVLEAMTHNLPVISTPVGGVPEVVVPGQTGLLVPTKDPDALAIAMIDLMRNAQTRQEFGAAGFERVRTEFSLDQMVDRYGKLYADLRAHGKLVTR